MINNVITSVHAGFKSKSCDLKKGVIAALMLAVMGATLFMQPASAQASIESFPPSYQPALRELQRRHPNWTFVPLHTNMDWNFVLTQQMVEGRSLVPASWEASMRDPSRPHQVEPGWVNASRGGIAFYMDPRNFLDERNILQFELLSFNSRYHTQAGVQNMLNGTFMAGPGNIRYVTTAGTTGTINQSYAAVIFGAGRDNLTNPHHLTARILQEVGSQGSPSVSGTVPGFTGIYNFYNIGATAGPNPVANGLRWASTGTSHGRPWTDPARSIRGGAQWISESYIRRGQDSLYLQKWSVSPNSPSNLHFWHQYMTNISAAATESQRLHTTYTNLGLFNAPRVFYIPVFNNMPEFPSYRPGNGFPDSDGTLFFINATSVNVRTGPGTGFASMGSFGHGTTFRVLNMNHTTANGHTWAQVQFANGRIGFIANSFLTPRRHADPIPDLRVATTNPNISFSPSWARVDHANFAGGSTMRADVGGAKASFTFTGTGIQFVTQAAPSHGAFDVYINGQFRQTVDTHSATLNNQRVVGRITGLAQGTHTVRIVTRPTANGARVNLDRIDVFGSPAAVGRHSAVPSLVVPNTNPALGFDSGWNRVSHANFSGGSTMRSERAGSELAFDFTGTGIQFITQTAASHGAFDVYINGQFRQTVNTHSATLGNQRVVGRIEGLPQGDHTVRIVTRTNARVNLDRIDIFGSPASVRGWAAPQLLLEQPPTIDQELEVDQPYRLDEMIEAEDSYPVDQPENLEE